MFALFELFLEFLVKLVHNAVAANSNIHMTLSESNNICTSVLKCSHHSLCLMTSYRLFAQIAPGLGAMCSLMCSLMHCGQIAGSPGIYLVESPDKQLQALPAWTAFRADARWH